jgi:hypothetical protein
VDEADAGRAGRWPAPLAAAAARARHLAARCRTLLVKRGPDVADLFFLGLLIAALAVGAAKGSFIFSGHVLVATMVGLSLCFLVTSRSLKVLGSPGLERTFIALAALVCAAWLYEFPFHYAWPTALDRLGRDLSNLGRNTTSGGAPWPFWWAVIMCLMPFAGIRYMRVNRWLLALSAGGAVTFFLWWASGFPDLFHPQWWPNQRPWIELIPPEFRHPRTDPALATVALYGGVFNSVTKVLICLIPATLFLPRPAERKAAPPMLEAKVIAALRRRVGRARMDAPPADEAEGTG